MTFTGVGLANLFLFGVAVIIIPDFNWPSLYCAFLKNKIIDAKYSGPVPPPAVTIGIKDWPE